MLFAEDAFDTLKEVDGAYSNRRVLVVQQNREQPEREDQRIVLPEPGLACSEDQRPGASNPPGHVYRQIDHPLVPPAGDARPQPRKPPGAVDAAVDHRRIHLPQSVVDRLSRFDAFDVEQVIQIPLVETEVVERSKFLRPLLCKTRLLYIEPQS